jgi:predicted PurR-regulated permease PerM
MKTLQHNDHWKTMVHESRFLYAFLALTLIGVMLTDFIAIFVLSTIFYMAYLESQKKSATYSPRKRKAIAWGTVAATLGFIAAVYFGLSHFFKTLNRLPEATDKGNLMDQLVNWLTPLKQTLTNAASYFLDSQEAVNFVDSKVSESIAKGAELVVSGFLHVITSFPEILLGLFVFSISSFIVARSYKNAKFKIFMYTQSSKARDRLKTLFQFCELSAYDTVVSTFVVAITQGVIISSGALLSGVSLWPVYFIVAFAFSFVPVVGLLPIIVIGGLHAYYLFGASSLLIFMIAGVVASTMDNVLRVLLLSQPNTVINPFISFFCLIGSISLFGLKGLILGPFLLSLAGYLLNSEPSQNSIETS